MTSWISKLRKKPKAVKDMYAFGGSLFVTGIIATIWLISLPSQLKPPAGELEAGADIEETRGAFAQFFAGAKAQLSNVFSSMPTSTLNVATSTEDNGSTTPKANIIIPQLSASTTDILNPEQILIETIPSPESKEPVEVLIGTSSAESPDSN